MRRKPSPRPALTSNPCSAARRARQPYGASGAPGGSPKTIGRTSLLVPQPARRHFCWSPLSRARWKSPARLSLAASSQAIPRDRARYPPRRPSSRHRWAPRRPPHSRTTPGPRPRTAAAYGLPCRAVELQGSGPAQASAHRRNWPGAARSRRRCWRSRSRRGHTSYICAAARFAPMRELERPPLRTASAFCRPRTAVAGVNSARPAPCSARGQCFARQPAYRGLRLAAPRSRLRAGQPGSNTRLRSLSLALIEPTPGCCPTVIFDRVRIGSGRRTQPSRQTARQQNFEELLWVWAGPRPSTVGPRARRPATASAAYPRTEGSTASCARRRVGPRARGVALTPQARHEQQQHQAFSASMKQ